ncbi:MAG TPA: hypothetical protein PLE72_11425 [Azospira sp.]|nr:hypothetical protein [Turneriella sp.]HNJ77369.1 hypothetical protein [Azospira sp.]HNN44945.1 hypothetical protein [Azospira sp.]
MLTAFTSLILQISPAMYRWFKRFCLFFVCSCLLLSEMAQADWTEVIRRMNTDTLVWRVNIVDSLGNPLPGATVWRMIPNGNQRKSLDLMQRLVRRYAFDQDFVMNTTVHPSLMVSYANSEGVFVESDNVNYHKSNDVTTIYAVLKRGYLPTILSDVARKNTTHEHTITLQPDPSAKVDQRMLQFDLIRAQAYMPAANAAERMQEDRRQLLLRTQQELRSLAQALEQDKQYDLASAVYYNLAFLPSVDVVRQPNGSEVIVGYTNGYDEKKVQRKTDMDKAQDLNQTNPNLIRKKMMRSFPGEDLGRLSPAQRQGYISLVEAQIRREPERVWPNVYFVSYQYLDEGLYAEACSALNRAYQFEPTYCDDNQWRSHLRFHVSQAKKAGYPGEVCTIRGIE